jgi:hypothetical protein
MFGAGEERVADLPAGFVLFAVLTFVTIYAQPAPLKLGAQKLIQLEERVLWAGHLGWQVSFPYHSCSKSVIIASESQGFCSNCVF